MSDTHISHFSFTCVRDYEEQVWKYKSFYSTAQFLDESVVSLPPWSCLPADIHINYLIWFFCLFPFSCPDTVFLKLLPLGWESLHCCVPCLFRIVLFHTCHWSHHGRLMAGEIQVSEDISLIQSACIDTMQPVQGQCCLCSQFWASSECSKGTLVKVSSSLLTELISLLMLFWSNTQRPIGNKVGTN